MNKKKYNIKKKIKKIETNNKTTKPVRKGYGKRPK